MNDKNCLWVVTSTGTRHYLAGSVHVLKEEDYPLNQPILNAFKSSEAIVVESDPYNAHPEELERLVQMYHRYSDGGSLQTTVSNKTFELVRSKAGEFGLDLARLNQLKPWVAEAIFTSLAFPLIGLDHEHGLDKYFVDQANEVGKQVHTLEALEDQYRFCDSIPLKAQERDLINTLSSFEKVKANLEEIRRSWLFGDVEGMEALLLEYIRMFPEAHEILITKRNQNWLPHIKSHLQDQRSVLIAVGVTHLVGENGIIRALQKEGYSIEQL
jgi:uncharacterized protein YbaP (TraB family)